MRIALIGSVFVALLPSVTHANDAFFGAWARGDGIAKVKVERCGAKICMIDTYIRPDVTDEKVGDRIVFDIRSASDGTLTGQGFDPKRDLSFSVVIMISGDRMTTKGCKLGGLICKSENWTRIR